MLCQFFTSFCCLLSFFHIYSSVHFFIYRTSWSTSRVPQKHMLTTYTVRHITITSVKSQVRLQVSNFFDTQLWKTNIIWNYFARRALVLTVLKSYSFLKLSYSNYLFRALEMIVCFAAMDWLVESDSVHLIVTTRTLFFFFFFLFIDWCFWD